MALLSRISEVLRLAVNAFPGSRPAKKELAQILDRAKAITYSDETHLPGYFTTAVAASFSTNEGACDVAIQSTGALVSILMESATSHSASFFVTDALTQLSLSGTTGNVYLTMSDNRAVALSMRISNGNSFITFCSTNNVSGAAGEYVELGGSATGVVWQRVESIADATTSKAVGVYDSGKVFVQLDADENVTFQLPATKNGLMYTFVCGHAGGEINISPAAADKITGKGIAGIDDQDIQNTNGTNAIGDCITLIGDGADGWIVVNMLGTWAVV